MADSLPAHLEPSKLGTKEYWDALYSTELSNHASNPADQGTVWFDDSDAEAKLLAFLAARDDPALDRAATSGDTSPVLSGDQDAGWDVVLDKGTFDAICLSDQLDDRGRRICEGYKEKVPTLVRPGGLFVVTSCNWTEEELRAWAFTFGGAKGQTISTLCFRRRS
ncbi:unnamed protein product [Parascedosporium putredinis]|uniref:Methyltransferase domain-containing protein n=1 Tax=Parascedosporium putredinis TaxID=1442378 RepID=A0A9P1H8H9_9PEZI|nr:unnamed protein product [Parascedosporium putredinis]CAI8000956.1 unnamed protein product [Parascedosporium putredinis]